MAKKEKEAKIVLERTYNVPLRRRWRYAPRYKKAKKAVTTLKEFIIKHMKPAKDEKGRILLKIGKYANDEIWKHGMKNPPHHIKVDSKKDEKGLVTVELTGAPKEEEKKPKKKEEKKETKEEVEKKEKQKEALDELKKQETEKPALKEEVKKKAVEEKPNAPFQR